jgi:hypothetical protein
MNKHFKPIFTPSQLQSEIWIPIKNFESGYQVSDLGRIKNLTTGRISHGHMNGKYLGWRYDHINNLSIYMHRLVLNHFKPNDIPNMSIHHLNGNKYDNRVCNLDWIDHSEHSRRHCYEMMAQGKLFIGNFSPRYGNDNNRYKGDIGQFTFDGILKNIIVGPTGAEKLSLKYHRVIRCTDSKKAYNNHLYRRAEEGETFIIGEKYPIHQPAAKYKSGGSKHVSFKGKIGEYNKNGKLLNIYEGSLDMERAGLKSRCVYACVGGKRKTYRKRIYKRLPIDFKYLSE